MDWIAARPRARGDEEERNRGKPLALGFISPSFLLSQKNLAGG